MASCIVDSNGNPVSSASYSYGYNRRAARSANLGGGDRPSESRNLRDLHKVVTRYDRQTLLSASRTLYLNSQILIGAIDQKAMYSVGNAWLPIYKGKDRAFGDAAKEWLSGEWYEICNIAGDCNDFATDLFIDSVAMDRDGEVFEYKTATPNGYPQIQQIPAHRIDAAGLPQGQLQKGRYSGTQFTHDDGIVYWKDTGKPAAYVLTDEDGRFERFIPAEFIRHIFDKLWPEQKRGLPLFYHSLNGLRDILQSEEWERGALLNYSSLDYTIHNETGGADMDEPDYVAPENCGDFSVQYIEGRRIRYARAGAGEKIEQHVNFRPGNPWMEFNDYQIRLALAPIWPMSMIWKPSGQGTAERNDIGKARRFVEDRQTMIHKIAKWRVTYALAWAMNKGLLPKSSDWWNWKFTKPRDLTIDDGRASKERLEKYRAGILNKTALIGDESGDFDEALLERGEEIAKTELNRMAMEKKYGITIDPRSYGLLGPNDQPANDGKQPNEEEP